uniref:tetratricopeptide repeat protein n=1 Tax=Corallococcus coralloides TaxID=184914 RepID=UPI000FFEEB6D|nr:tetratricopeptide repeat protein [Corallococcus coralloides]
MLVIPWDLDRAQDPDHKFALQLLAESVLEDREMATAALAVLATDAGDVCARKLRRTRKELVDLLAGTNIKVRPPAKDDRWHRELDFSRQLLQKKHPAVALELLNRMDSVLGTQRVEPYVRYRLDQQRSTAFAQLGRYDEALRYARSALEVVPSGARALQIAALAALHSGDVGMARTFVDQGVRAHPVDSDLWGVKAQVATAAGEPLPTPPSAVSTSEEYRTVLAHVAADVADWSRVLELTGSLLADGMKTPDVVFLRANAFLCVSMRTSDAVDRAQLEDVERLTSELIRLCADDAHPFTRKGLALRAMARSLLGRADEAEVDLRLARELSADDPDTIYQAARIKVGGGDESGALDLLRHPVADENPPLAAMRAHLFARRGEKDAARRDIDAVLRRLTKAVNFDLVRFTLADAALEISDVDLAARILTGVTPKGVSEPLYSVMRGRIAFGRGNIDEGTACFREARERDESDQPGIVTELGSHLLKAGRTKEALQAFDELGPAKVPTSALRVYANALMRADELVRAKSLVEQMAVAGSLPDWALRMAADIALRQEDVGAALRHLTALVEGGQSVPRKSSPGPVESDVDGEVRRMRAGCAGSVRRSASLGPEGEFAVRLHAQFPAADGAQVVLEVLALALYEGIHDGVHRRAARLGQRFQPAVEAGEQVLLPPLRHHQRIPHGDDDFEGFLLLPPRGVRGHLSQHRRGVLQEGFRDFRGHGSPFT